MRYWFDTELIERGPLHPVQLLSIGIVAEDGREFYRESSWTNHENANEWVKENVLPQMQHCPAGGLNTAHGARPKPGCGPELIPTCPIRTRQEMAQEIYAFIDPAVYGKPEIWAYYADYDWVTFCQIFGTMMDLPEGFPMYCRDIKQEADRIEAWIQRAWDMPSYKLKLPEQGKGEHHALADARWNKEAYLHLLTMGAHGRLDIRGLE